MFTKPSNVVLRSLSSYYVSVVPNCVFIWNFMHAYIDLKRTEDTQGAKNTQSTGITFSLYSCRPRGFPPDARACNYVTAKSPVVVTTTRACVNKQAATTFQGSGEGNGKLSYKVGYTTSRLAIRGHTRG